jgi:hypothetical protein
MSLVAEWLLGSLVKPLGTTVFTQEATFAMVTWVRHLPAWMTKGMSGPTGMFVSVNVPSTAVVVLTKGEPEAGVPATSQATPAVNAGTLALGT